MTRGPELLGEMVRLRTLVATDADRMWESLQDPEAMRLTGTTADFTREQVEEWTRTVADRPGRYDWAITPAAERDGALISDEMIGEIVLNEIDTQARSANIRLVLLPNYRGRGYGRDAIFQVLQWAFTQGGGGLDLHRVSLDVLALNPRAHMLYESLGFRDEGRLRDAYLDGEHYSDAIVMAILEDEFRALLPQH